MKKITIVTSGHPPDDERIYFKFARSLKTHGYNVTIVCSNLEINTEKNGIVLSGFDGNLLRKSRKISQLEKYISGSDPDLIICCEPLTILSAHNYKKSSHKKVTIISDITEWYPENVALKFKNIKRLIEYVKLFLFNIYTIHLADALIIGEITKKRRYNIIAPFKPKIIIGYYPVLEFFPPLYTAPKLNELTLGYAGVITFERGILTLLRVAEKLAELHPEINVRVKVAGKFQYPAEEQIFNEHAALIKKVKITLCEWVEYPKMASSLRDMDICLDLRKKTFIYRNSLPIKIFEYLACSKPIIYSDIKPIRKEMQTEKFGFLVDPENDDEIVNSLEQYIKHPKLIQTHSSEARKAVEQKYNWEVLQRKLIDYVKKFL